MWRGAFGTPLLEAIAYRDLDTVRTLIASGTDLTEYNSYKVTPLDSAVRQGYYDIVVMLLDAGVDINFFPPGETTGPLHGAKAYGRLD